MNVNDCMTKSVANMQNTQKQMSKKDKELLDACKSFESIFVNMMFKEMNKTVCESGLTEKSSGRKMFEEMYTEKLADDITQNGQGIGLAQVMFENMKRSMQ